jgi:hypothetical protein
MREPTDASKLLRAGLLEGVAVLCAGAPGAFGEEVARACAQLGGAVSRWEPESPRASAEVLCYDGAATFARAGAGRGALDACLAGAWEVTHATVAEPLLARQATAELDGGASGSDRAREPHPARLVYIAPVAGSGEHAEAARAGLENLARTLSIEWARFGVGSVAFAPGANTSALELGALVAYIASPAGGYFSGCLFDLTGAAVSLPS